ncbi:ABC transporter ATP-binding protein [Agromyces sp. SYSU T00194]|uniref:ABC transporter ATP-binding protein n=1 Tax=Agromyces chitinivorans TaxID=3158560 RepID=UPI00339474AC
MAGRPDTIALDERPDVVDVADVSKRFVIRKDNSLKERLVTFGRAGRRHREDFWALRDIALTLKAGTTVGLIGHNGSGKSTLLKVIGGIIDPTSGSVRRRGRIAALLELGAGFHPDLTGRENVFLNASILGLSQRETEERFDDILEFSGIGEFIDTQVKFYSSGMYVRLAFAVAVHTDPDILLVDEVLAVGDEAFQRKCLDKIRSFQQDGRTIVLVTHNLGQVTELCDRAVLLHHGNVVHDGDPATSVEKFRDLLEQDRRAHDAEKGIAEHADGRILEVVAHAVGREVGEQFQPGDTLSIRVTLEHPTGLDDWSCGVQVVTPLGPHVYGTSTRLMGVETTHLRERRTIEFLIDDLRLGGGQYFVHASLMDATKRHLFDAVQATSFTVPVTRRYTGSIDAQPSFVDHGD